MAIGWLHGEPWKDEQLIDWPLWSQGFKGGLETLELLNQYGLNMYEILAGMVPWIVMAAHEGVLTENDFGFPIDPNNTEWWVSLLRMITFKEGFGEILAEGTTRAIDTLGKEKYGNTIYTGIRTLGGRQAETPISLQQAWGYAEHWSGRGLHSSLPYPEWRLRALTWMTQSRDSNNDTHHRDRAEWMDAFYTNPYRGSIGPWMAIWDEHRSELKCSLTLCDRVFPMPYYSSVEAELFSAVTGQDIAEDELDKIGERLKNLQRAILIRNHNRSRDVETGEILPFFKRPDGTKVFQLTNMSLIS
jgi:aldehyde:ferredoxin oxidoreductase